MTAGPGVDVAPEPADGPEPARGPGREFRVASVVAVVATVVAWLRMPVNTRGRLYAEDGQHFVSAWVNRPAAGLLVEPYAGYQHLVPRLVGGLVVWSVPKAGWAVAVNLIVCLILGGAAALIYVYSRDVVAFGPARVALALIIVVVPIAGQEPLGNLANLHWFLLYLLVWVLLAVPRSAPGERPWSRWPAWRPNRRAPSLSRWSCGRSSGDAGCGRSRWGGPSASPPRR